MIKYLILFLLCSSVCYGKVIIYPAPKGEVLSNSYVVSAGGKSVPVYNAKISANDDKRRFAAVDDVLHSADYYDTASFSYFDLEGQASVNVSVKYKISTVKILPASANIHYVLRENTLSFIANKAMNLTIEINGETVKSLHIFVNPLENNIPNANDPNVIYFGPGIHYLDKLVVSDNKTIYIAGGAIVRSVIGKDERFGVEPSGLRNYDPRILLKGNHIRIMGHGIIDAGECPTHAGNFIVASGSDISLNGIIVRNSCGWTIPLRQCNNTIIDNVKLLGYRANTDGIDICNSNNVLVKNCFVRTGDDLIVVKTEQGEGPSSNVIIDNCTLWNPVAHALSIGAEIRENVSNVVFKNCDIIHDRGREWSLRIFQSDSSTVSDIKFENIRIEESHRLISLWIDKNASSLNNKLGYINNILFKNISATGNPLHIEMHGGDNVHTISCVKFTNVILNKKKLNFNDIEKNQFYKQLYIADF